MRHAFNKAKLSLALKWPACSRARFTICHPIYPTRPIPRDNQSKSFAHLSKSSDKTTLAPNVIFLSPRDWLAQWPRRLQIFAVALLLFASVAQSWHVCAMGSHALCDGHADDVAMRYVTVNNADGSPGPVVCAPVPPQIHGNAFAPHAAANGAVDCLAMLLQTMPLQAGVPFTLELRETPRTTYAERAEINPAFASPLALRGRAPPATC